MNPITCACHLQPEHPLLPTCTFASSPLCLLGTFPGKWTHLAQLLPLGNSWTQLQKSPEGPTIMSVVVATWPWGLCVQSGTAATSIGIHCEAWAHLFIPKDTSSATDQKKTLRMGTVISWKSTPVPYSGIKKKKKCQIFLQFGNAVFTSINKSNLSSSYICIEGWEKECFKVQ